MRFLIRAILVLVGTIVATAAAGFAAALGGTAMQATISDFSAASLDVLWNTLVTGLFVWMYLIFWIAFVPYLIAAAVAEIFGVRSLLLYLIGAIAIACLSPVFAGRILPWFGGIPISSDLIVSSVAAGFAAGLVYWLIAGRNAGRRKHA